MNELLIFGILGLGIITLAILVIILHLRLKKLMSGKSVQSLEKVIVENNKRGVLIQEELKKQNNQIKAILKDTESHIQNIGVVRFNPFKETGGSQSFAIALTDKNENGVVISSLYTRDRVNVFAKPITAGSSEYTLTKEEQSALQQSRN
ncbi:MAG: DUF4446 family protein [Candidatus Pacebacteria bacterium]|nr:DUF4446 family protein [Candidatus Paceibacterota bacterium]